MKPTGCKCGNKCPVCPEMQGQDNELNIPYALNQNDQSKHVRHRRSPVRPLHTYSHCSKCRATFQWVHIVCGLFVPELFFLDTNRLEPIAGIQNVSVARRRLLCCICKQRGGACIQCHEQSCTCAFHAPCARAQGWDLRLISDSHQIRGVNFVGFCNKHRRSPRQYDLLVYQLMRKQIADRSVRVKRSLAAALVLQLQSDSRLTPEETQLQSDPGGLTQERRRFHSDYGLTPESDGLMDFTNPRLFFKHKRRRLLKRKRNPDNANASSSIDSPTRTPNKKLKRMPVWTCVSCASVNQSHRTHCGSCSSPCTSRHKFKQLQLSSSFTMSSSKKRSPPVSQPYTVPIYPVVRLYCICRMPCSDSDFMIACDMCDEWFHGPCVLLTPAQAGNMLSFQCPQCKRNQNKKREANKKTECSNKVLDQKTLVKNNGTHEKLKLKKLVKNHKRTHGHHQKITKFFARIDSWMHK